MTEFKPHLEYLSAREQLMEDIDSIVESQCGKGSEELVALLCDAVCERFPTQAQGPTQATWIPNIPTPE